MATEKAAKEKIGVLMVGHGEPETFEEGDWPKIFREMWEEAKKQGRKAPPDTALPMMLEKAKEKYEAMGGRSRHVEVCKKQCKLVAKQLLGYDVRIGFLEFVSPAFTEVAGQMIKDGIKKIVFIPMLETDSTHTGEIKSEIKEMKLEETGIKWVMSKPLIYRPEPIQVVEEMITKAVGRTPLDEVGVILASHGEPEEYTETSYLNTRCNEQETAFSICVKKGLIERGFVWDNITQGFNESAHPELPEAVEKLKKRNVKKVVSIATFGSADGIHVNYDIPTKVKSGLVDPGIELICLGGWNYHPLLIKAYAELAKKALKKL